MVLQTYIAHYASPKHSDVSARGLFEFESIERMGTKALSREARLRMLELYGKDAVSWTIDRIERKRATTKDTDGQLELDFSVPEKPRKRKAKKEYW